MRVLHAGRVRYQISGSDPEIALAHALGIAFVELQQLEFAIISLLSDLAGGEGAIFDASFDVFASKTFGNLIREMDRHDFLRSLAKEMTTVKLKRDFFIHKFLFHRYGGATLTLDTEYEVLIKEAASLGDLFAQTRTRFHDFMLQNAPLVMLAAKRDPNTGELIIVESEFSKRLG
jgi:hypothetical protein